ncbi:MULTISPECIES: hypothetical protein [Pectobacterium]|uniref:hypothetical protein n=1 Tax=Pectobacterium TaxID=122277 RepID=UPI0015DF841C|nr:MULTISPECIES: hypothetical protein [Pectobacterium]MBA0190120.1 hypothetical protein [Pectobacterium odoriferum]MCL6393236.1 hypothetical protein [Pectobacterium atrosepticum]GKW44262.1 hypothetical protein PEC301879_41200 [Pectobacterium carotovorum subsp. carotovorum]
MFDDTPLRPDELLDQCCALSYAVTAITHDQVREILAFVLHEKLRDFYDCYHPEQLLEEDD